jgi:hypothetical protein
MNTPLTAGELESRWQEMLALTAAAVNRNPGAYRELKTRVRTVLDSPLDIDAYLPMARALVRLLEQLDPAAGGTIFCGFRERLAPCDLWHMKLLRVECMDLLDHLEALDSWRRETCGLRLVPS